MGFNNKKSVRELLLILNIACEGSNVEYKVSYDYKYISSKQAIGVNRKMVAFSGHTPSKWFYPEDDQTLIKNILDELELYD